jgi:ubiquinol-cytochrome c reductase cytochrome b subunit
MSQAYETTIRLSFDVRAGLVMRQIHHWAALVFIATIVAHLCRIFFTGAFRRPRELNWIIGVTLLVLAIFNGFAGYSLPDDLLSGTGLRIAYSIALAVPVIGTWLAFLLFGGEFPSHDILSRLFVIHILLIPVAIAALLSVHLAIVWRQKHTQLRGRGRREDNVVGSRLWPTYTAKSIGLFAIIAGVLSLLGGLAQINPVWLYGPFDPSAVSTAAQPDWYLGWVEGALRIAPPAFLKIGPYSVSELFWPAILLPTVTFLLLYAWPFLERRFTRDHASHNLLDRPRDAPWRTACGAALLSFVFTVFLAGSADRVTVTFGIDYARQVTVYRIAIWVIPLVVLLVTKRVCTELRAGERVSDATVGEPEPGTR